MSDESNKKNSQRSGCSRWIKRGCGIIAVSIMGLILIGFIYQETAMYIDWMQFPPPGEMVDVGGYKLHLYCVGNGSPTVVLEAGLGDNWLTWGLVQEKIAGFTRVCAYDRAGLGWSGSSPEPLTTPQVAESLHTLLKNADVQGPYILVGHSIGGIFIRSYAQQYPEDVVGMVLVDSSHENQLIRFPKELVEYELKNLAGLKQTLTLCRFLSPVGLVRLLGLTAGAAQDKPLSPEQRQMLIATLNKTNYCTAVGDEIEMAIQKESNQTRPLYKLGDIPLIVLTVPSDSSGKNPEDLPPGVTKEMAEQADKLFMELQQELADLSTNGTLVIVENKGHYIQFDQPDLVIESIRKIINLLDH